MSFSKPLATTVLREDINALCASLEFSQCQIDDFRKEKTVLKGPVDSVHGKVEVVQREHKQLIETLMCSVGTISSSQ